MLTWREPKSDYTNSSQVTPLIFNELAENEKYLNAIKIATNEVQNAVIMSDQSTARVNLNEQDTVMGAFGKIRKWFSDLKEMAFKDKVNDNDVISVDVNKITGLGVLAIKNDVGNDYITDVNGDKVKGTVPQSFADGNGRNIDSTYMKKEDPYFTGSMTINNAGSVLQKNSITPDNNNIGVTGIMLTHYDFDEGGLLINADGAYLWNSTDSGSALKIIDEDLWQNVTLKKDATFTDGLLLDLDSAGNLKIKGNIYKNNGTEIVGTSSASSISITKNAHLGNATTLQEALDYIAKVFAGTQKVEKLTARIFDAQD